MARILVFLAPGSLGDALPLWKVAHSLFKQSTDDSLSVRFVANQRACEAILALTRYVQHRSIHIVPIPTYIPSPYPPTCIKNVFESNDGSDVRNEWNPLCKCETCHERSVMANAVGIHFTATGIQPKQDHNQIIGVVFNLFAVDGWSLADALGVPSLALSPFNPTITDPLPNTFLTNLQETRPGLASVIRKMDFYQDVVVWQWRLFMDDVGRYRCALGLDPAPYAWIDNMPTGLDQDRHSLLSSRMPKLLIMQSPFVFGPNPTRSDGNDTMWISPGVCMVGFCGFDESDIEPDQRMQHELDRISSWLDSTDDLYCDISDDLCIAIITFGSMDMLSSELLIESTTTHIIRCIMTSFQLENMRCVWIVPQPTSTHGMLSILANVIMNVSRKIPDTIMRVVDIPIPTHMIISACETVPKRREKWCERRHVIGVHHGGSGTFHTFMKCSVPQIVVPFGFDQLYNAKMGSGLGICVCMSRQELASSMENRSMRWCDEIGVVDWRDAIDRVRSQCVSEPVKRVSGIVRNECVHALDRVFEVVQREIISR